MEAYAEIVDPTLGESHKNPYGPISPKKRTEEIVKNAFHFDLYTFPDAISNDEADSSSCDESGYDSKLDHREDENRPHLIDSNDNSTKETEWQIVRKKAKGVKVPMKQTSKIRKPGTRGESKSGNFVLACAECSKIHVAPQKTESCHNRKHLKIHAMETQKGFVAVRKKKAYHQTTLCRHNPMCRDQSHCKFAHSEEELEFWKGGIQPQYEFCIDCSWTALTNDSCISPQHASTGKVVLYRDESNRKIVPIRIPLNWSEMHSESYVMNHTSEGCTLIHPKMCTFPHDRAEEKVWNEWKKMNHRLPYDELSKIKYFYSQLTKLEVPTAQRRYGKFKWNVSKDLLRKELTSDNYRDKMATLIKCEEESHEEELRKYDTSYRLIYYDGYGVNPKHHDWYAAIPMMQVLADKLRQAATHVDIAYRKYLFNAQLLKVQKFRRHTRESLLVVGLMSDNNDDTYDEPRILEHELQRTSEIEINVHFILKYSYFNNLRKAISWLPSQIVEKLVPGSEHVSKTKEIYSGSSHALVVANDFPEDFQVDAAYQLEAIRKSYSCPPSLPFLLMGPFGTGKTRVIAASAYHILRTEKDSRILIATHHNGTADYYTSMYFTKETLKQNLNRISAVRLTAMNSRTHLDESVWNLPSGEIRKYQLVITTFITSLHMKNPGQFTHIFIDEGAQAREPECVAAFRFATPQTRIVIAGDDKQVGPRTTVLGVNAREYGLSKSLLERLHSLYSQGNLKAISKHYEAILLNSYRCLPEIVQLPGTLFYQRLNIQAKNDIRPHPCWEFPLQFVCTSVDEAPLCKWTSEWDLKKTADTEVKALQGIVQKCIDTWPVDKWGKKNLSSLCVVTPTRFTQRLWRMKVRGTELEKVTHTVAYDIQGMEYRAVFLCTSEAVNDDFTPLDHVKSLCDPRVFNTIITRSQSLVIAVGNPFRLMEIEHHMPKGSKQCWLQYFQACNSRQALVPFDQLDQNQPITKANFLKLQAKIGQNIHTLDENLVVDEKDSSKEFNAKAHQWPQLPGTQTDVHNSMNLAWSFQGQSDPNESSQFEKEFSLKKDIHNLKCALERGKEEVLKLQKFFTETEEAVVKLESNVQEGYKQQSYVQNQEVKNMLSNSENEEEGILQKLCWFPFPFDNVQVGSEGGLFFLENAPTPTNRDFIDGYTYIEISPNTLEKDETLCIRFGITPTGPFKFPEGYKLCSMVVYVVVEGAKVKKKMRLHIPHWCSEDSIRLSDCEEELHIMSCWSPHILCENQEMFIFKKFSEMTNKTGTASDIFIDGDHCLFAVVCKKCVQDRYLSHVFKEKKSSDWMTTTSSPATRLYKIVVSYASFNWYQIIDEYYKPWRGNCERVEVYNSPFTIESETLEACISSSTGNRWAITLIGSPEMNKNDFDYMSTLESNDQDSEIPPHLDLKKRVETSFYPPSFTYEVVQEVLPPGLGRGYHCSPRHIDLPMKKLRPSVQIPIPVNEWKIDELQRSASNISSGSTTCTPMELEKSPQSLLEKYQQGILSKICAKEIATKLCDSRILPVAKKKAIEEADTKEKANSILWNHMYDHLDHDSCEEVFKVCQNEDGYPILNRFAEKILEDLANDKET
jgi:hypothetical protein